MQPLCPIKCNRDHWEAGHARGLYDAGCWSSAWDSASTCIHPRLSRALPSLRTGEGSQQAAPPFLLSPALCGAILLVFSSRALADFCGDAKLLLQNPLIHPHGGLTPRLGFFSLLLITPAGLGLAPPVLPPWEEVWGLPEQLWDLSQHKGGWGQKSKEGCAGTAPACSVSRGASAGDWDAAFGDAILLPWALGASPAPRCALGHCVFASQLCHQSV